MTGVGWGRPNARVLILGGTGFIGSRVAFALQKLGMTVVLFGRQQSPDWARAAGLTCIQGDVRDRESVYRAVAGCAVVCHSVSSTVPGTAESDPDRNIAENLVPMADLLENMRLAGCRRIVFMSSGGTVYGNAQNFPTRETEPLLPIGSYGRVKVACEGLIDAYKRSHGFEALVLRPGNPVGPGHHANDAYGLVPAFIKKISTQEVVEVRGDGSATRDYFHVDDLARLVAMALERDIWGTFNAGTGVSTSIKQMIEIIEHVVGRQARVSYHPKLKHEVDQSVLDVTEAKTQIGWVAQKSVEEAVRGVWQSLGK
jgi:UDP-glucose 4-epimerase